MHITVHGSKWRGAPSQVYPHISPIKPNNVQYSQVERLHLLVCLKRIFVDELLGECFEREEDDVREQEVVQKQVADGDLCRPYLGAAAEAGLQQVLQHLLRRAGHHRVPVGGRHGQAALKYYIA